MSVFLHLIEGQALEEHRGFDPEELPTYFFKSMRLVKRERFQFGFAQIMNLIIEIGADAPHGAGIGPHRFGLESFEFKVFKMGLIILLEIGFG